MENVAAAYGNIMAVVQNGGSEQMRPIDADRIEYINGHLIINEYLQDEYDGEFVDKYSIDNLPTIEAIPVVRCKDCIHHEDEEPGMVYCPAVMGGWVNNDFFCGNGERREK